MAEVTDLVTRCAADPCQDSSVQLPTRPSRPRAATFFQAVAVDLDGTLTTGDHLSAEIEDAIEGARDSGLAVILVTGRILAEATATFPTLREHFDAIVSENGSVLVLGEMEHELAPPVDVTLTEALDKQDVPFRRGEVLVACSSSDAAAVAGSIAALGLDCQLLRNRDALMVLPAGVSKGTGLVAALRELGISVHNTLAVGDAENDLALLEVAEIGLAVANAVPSLREHADLVLEEPDGLGVAAVLKGPLVAGSVVLRPERRRIQVGTFVDGAPAKVPGAQANILVCGDSGAGKSYTTGLLIEEWIGAGYSVFVLDLEGDHLGLEQLRRTVVVGHDTLPDEEDLTSLLRQQGISVVLDLSHAGEEERARYLDRLPSLLAAERLASGVPHWIVVDEAHELFADHAPFVSTWHPVERGWCLATYRPEELDPDVLGALDATITATGTATGAVARTATVVEAGPAPWPVMATLSEAGGPPRTLFVGHRRTLHVRHRNKYATRTLAADRSFSFRLPDGQITGVATSLPGLVARLREVDLDVVEHHVLRGDFSKWMAGSVKDQRLARVISSIEQHCVEQRNLEIGQARERIVSAIEARFREEGPTRHGR